MHGQGEGGRHRAHISKTTTARDILVQTLNEEDRAPMYKTEAIIFVPFSEHLKISLRCTLFTLYHQGPMPTHLISFRSGGQPWSWRGSVIECCESQEEIK